MIQMVMMKPEVVKLQTLIKVMEKVILLTAYLAEAAFYTQLKRFLIEDNVDTSLRNDPELYYYPTN